LTGSKIHLLGTSNYKNRLTANYAEVKDYFVIFRNP
jgi:hypothetical protein